MIIGGMDSDVHAANDFKSGNVLLPDNVKKGHRRSFGSRKYVNVPLTKQSSMGKKGNKQWVHPPEALLRGHIVYNVKFLGHVEVEEPKGTDVVKEAIRKMKFNKQIKKAEGQKTPKVELTISIDGLTVQEPKHKIMQYSYPLHRISYCADDKSDKRMFTFIAKEPESAIHHCFVFDSEKCAEEITLTVGQAFDLAYRRFLDSSGKDMDTKKQYLLAQKKIQQLTTENLELKARVADLERLVDGKVLQEFDSSKSTGPSRRQPLNQTSNHQSSDTKITSLRTPSSQNPFNATPIPRIPPPGSVQNGNQPEVGRKLENLMLDDLQANGAPAGSAAQPSNSSMPKLAPPPPVPSRSTPQKNNAQPAMDLFGSPPFQVGAPEASSPSQPPVGLASPLAPPPTNKASYRENPFNSGGGGGDGEDPFGMGNFNPGHLNNAADLDRQIQKVDQELLDLQTGFSQGLSFGTADFSLEDLDPLNKK